VRADPKATELRAEAVRIGRGATQSDADSALQAIEVSLCPRDGDAGTALARAKFPRSSTTRNYSVRWTIVAPAAAVVEADVDVGESHVIGFSNAIFVKTGVGAI